ncbi:MAG: hypothetical protein NTX74_06175 [Flavobacterium sp.]|nr:hypothetical protein [Flavobacterium sp.]
MKKIIFFNLSILLFSFSSCERDPSLDPRPVIVDGNFMRLDITNRKINYDDMPNSFFGGILSNPGGKVIQYDLYVRRTDTNNNLSGEFVFFKTITTFPFELKIYAQEIVNTLGISITQLSEGDIIRFIGVAKDSQGNITNFYNLSPTIQSNQAYYKQAFRFGTYIVDEAALNSKTPDNYDPQ